jgi:hypothetical protein
MNLETDDAVWRSDIELVNVYELLAGFWRPLVVISTFGWYCRLSIYGWIVY